MKGLCNGKETEQALEIITKLQTQPLGQFELAGLYAKKGVVRSRCGRWFSQNVREGNVSNIIWIGPGKYEKKADPVKLMI